MPEVYADEQVTIELIADLGSFANNCYIIRPTNGDPAVVIDIPDGFEAVVEALGDRPVGTVIATHSHRDHWDGFDRMRESIDAPVLCGAEETEIAPERAAERLADGAEVPVGEARMRVIHTPGHTPGSICLLLGGALLTGDALFPGGPGHSRSNEALQQEIQSITSKLYPLPAETVVLPGHGPGTTLGESQREYEVFAGKEHAPDLHGDVLWLES